jgi:hypothetical protein
MLFGVPGGLVLGKWDLVSNRQGVTGLETPMPLTTSKACGRGWLGGIKNLPLAGHKHGCVTHNLHTWWGGTCSGERPLAFTRPMALGATPETTALL